MADSQDAQLRIRIRLLAPLRALRAQSFLSNVPPLERVEAAGYARRPGQERAGRLARLFQERQERRWPPAGGSEVQPSEQPWNRDC